MYYKYPRTPHFPWSPGKTRDDRVIEDPNIFLGRKVVVTTKMDGENSTLYSDHIHARSLDSKDHESRHWIKGLHRQISYLIPRGWRICGENLYAKHSIHYKKLPSYFMVFSIWNNKNECIAWDETLELCDSFGLEHVPTLYIGYWEGSTPKILEETLGDNDEGYVVRMYKSFHYDDFENNVAKFVRENHVQTDKHWMHQQIIKNQLKE